MGFLSFLSSNKTNNKKKLDETKSDKKKQKKTTADSVKTHGTSSSNSTTTKSSKQQQQRSKTNEDVVAELLAALNSHASVEELVSFFASPDVTAKFEDGISMTVMVLMTQIHQTIKGFHNLRFNFDCIKETKDGVIMVDDVVVTGTHTGDFGFGPFPPIPATGKHVILDAERFLFKMKEGKIRSWETIALGNLTGPPGMYVSVGGTMEMPPPAPPATTPTE